MGDLVRQMSLYTAPDVSTLALGILHFDAILITLTCQTDPNGTIRIYRDMAAFQTLQIKLNINSSIKTNRPHQMDLCTVDLNSTVSAIKWMLLIFVHKLEKNYILLERLAFYCIVI